MIRIKEFILITCCMLCLLPLKAQGQHTQTNQEAGDKLLVAAREIMEASGTCALVTTDDGAEILP